MTRCPDTGAVRAALDGERADVEAHLRECEGCQRRAAQLEGDAAVAAASFAQPVPTGDADAALSQRRREQAVVPQERRNLRRWPQLSRVAAALLVAAVVGGVVATPDGRAVAGSLLDRFRAERVAVVPFDVASVDPAALDALADVAVIEGPERPVEPRAVADLDAAAEVAGFTAAPLDTRVLPDAAGDPVQVLAQPPQTVRVAFPDLDDVSPELRDSVLVLDLPGAVLQTVDGRNGTPIAVRGEAGSLEAAVEGEATLAEVRDALLSLPGLPDETVAALREIEDWETTLPLPLPVDDIAWQESVVAGGPALAFGDESGLGSALLWREGQRFVGVGGRLPLSQVRQLAEPQ